MSYQDNKPAVKEKNIENTDEQIVGSVNADFAKAYRAKQSKEILFEDIYRRYRSYLDASQETTRSTLFIPESFTLVETVAPRMTARKPTFKAIPRTSEDISKADSIGQLLDYRYDVMDLHPRIKTYAKQGVMYGTSIMKMGWDPEEERPAAEVVDIADLFPDPDTCSWTEGFVIHRYYRTHDQLKKSPIKYQNLDQVEGREKSATRDDRMKQDRNAIQGIPYDNDKAGFECLEWWGRVDGKLRKRVIVDRSILVLDTDPKLPLDEYPFVPFYDQEVPFEKWGIGEIEPILDLQDEENTTRNQRIDEKNLSIHNMWIVSKMAGIDTKNMVSKPGGIILANDINGIKPLDKQNITQNSIEEIRLIKEDIRNATGVNDYIRGSGTAGTATETVTKTAEANQRFAEKVNNLEIALKKIGKWVLAFDAQNLTSNIQIRITGKYGIESKEISLEDIKAGYDIDIETGSSLPANPDLRRQQLKELVTVIAPFLMSPNGIPDGMRELLRSVIQSYDLKNADEILQGAQHPMVNQVMANLAPDEMGGANPQLVEQEVKRILMGQGDLSQMPVAQAGQQPGQASEVPNTPLPPVIQ